MRALSISQAWDETRDILTRDGQGRLANVLCSDRVVQAPADVTACGKNFGELALVIEQADVAFGHEERATQVLEECATNGTADNADVDCDGDFVFHIFPFGINGTF